MESDEELFSLLDSVNLLLGACCKLENALRSARLELSYSRTHRGSLTGASFAYVPRKFFMSKVRILINNGIAELVKVPKQQSKRSEKVTSNDGLRFRNKRDKSSELEEENTKTVLDKENDDSLSILQRSDPLSWFGENSSPSVLSSKANFEEILRLCLETMNMRTSFQHKTKS
jgi:hypothetical protein